MKTLMALVFALTTNASFAQKNTIAETYKIVPAQSSIEWVGTKVTGEHKGKVSVKEGTLTKKGDLFTNGKVVVDMNSMTVTDITDADTAGKFLGHMKSADFFNTEKYPTATFDIKSSKKVAKGLQITGDLTMIGQTKPVTFLVTDLKTTGSTLTAKSQIKIDRTKWGLKYGSGQFFKGLGDKMIHDEFILNVDLTATK